MKKWKLFAPVLLTVVLLVGNVVSVSAASSTEWPSNLPAVPEGYSSEEGWYHVICSDPRSDAIHSYPDQVALICFKYSGDPGGFQVRCSSNLRTLYVYFSDVSLFDAKCFYVRNTSETSWSGGSYSTPSTSPWSNTLHTGNHFDEDLLFSDVDIYDSTGKELFFQRPRTPGKVELSLTETLQTMGAGPLREVILMIPIGLGCLVLYMGLRKALALLRQILLQA